MKIFRYQFYSPLIGVGLGIGVGMFFGVLKTGCPLVHITN